VEKNLKHFVRAKRGDLNRFAGCAFFSLLALAFFPGLPPAARAQTAPSGFEDGFTLSAGATASGYYIGYGQRKIAGPAIFIDADTRHRYGIEGEARWLNFPQTANVHNTTWLVGVRYSFFQFDHRFYPYAKGMVGFTQFNFPYNYAKGDYLVIAPGGGLDYRLSHRVRIRIVDAEYQIWPQFTFGNTSSWGVSTGLRLRVF
jgi:hypothetical protein